VSGLKANPAVNIDGGPINATHYHYNSRVFWLTGEHVAEASISIFVPEICVTEGQRQVIIVLSPNYPRKCLVSSSAVLDNRLCCENRNWVHKVVDKFVQNDLIAILQFEMFPLLSSLTLSPAYDDMKTTTGAADFQLRWKSGKNSTLLLQLFSCFRDPYTLHGISFQGFGSSCMPLIPTLDSCFLNLLWSVVLYLFCISKVIESGNLLLIVFSPLLRVIVVMFLCAGVLFARSFFSLALLISMTSSLVLPYLSISEVSQSFMKSTFQSILLLYSCRPLNRGPRLQGSSCSK
jgi:hypothetical protein